MKVFVLDKHHKPLMPTTPARARQLLKAGRVVVHKLQPFTIRTKDRLLEDSVVQPVRLKIDPGSKVTGMALVSGCRVLHLAELQHKAMVHKKMVQRASRRKRRRSANLRYRPPRFLNRTKPKGWLAPSLLCRLDETLSWVSRYRRLVPVSAISMELARFDTQRMERPEISGVEYQQGTLAGYDIREYLLEKWRRKCAYCGKENVPLQIEHIVPKSRGGSNRVSNLTLSCEKCNQKKGAQTAAEFGYPKLQAQAKKPLKDAAVMNATRWALWRALDATRLPLEVGTGSRTKWQRTKLGLPKTHAFDALSVGKSTPAGFGELPAVLTIRAIGRGQYRRTQVNRFGFPRRASTSERRGSYLMKHKRVHGFGSGDMVLAMVPRGKYEGVHRGHCTVRRTGRFDVRHDGKLVANGVKWLNCRLLQRADGYRYSVC